MLFGDRPSSLKEGCKDLSYWKIRDGMIHLFKVSRSILP